MSCSEQTAMKIWFFLQAGSISTEVHGQEFSNQHKDSVLLVWNIHSWWSSGCLSHMPLMCKTPSWGGGRRVASKAFRVFEGSMVGPLVSFLVSVFEKLKQTERSISVTSGARPPPPPTPTFDAGWLFISSTSFKSMLTEGRKSHKFPRPSLATGVCCFYWAFEMVRVWSCDMLGQWNVVGGRMGLGEF